MLTIAFDLDDTLYGLEGPYLQMLAESFPGTDLPGRELFLRQLDHFEECFRRAQAGDFPMENLFAERQVLAFGDFGLPVTQERALELQDCYHDCQRRIALSDEVRGMLDKLVAARDEGRLRVGILSNGHSQNQWRKIRILGLERWFPREQIVVSEDVGCAKPDARIFELALGQLGGTIADVEAGDCWYVGDSLKNDVAGARNAGWKCIWVDHGYKTPGRESANPDLTARDEHQMVDAVLSLL